MSQIFVVANIVVASGNQLAFLPYLALLFHLLVEISSAHCIFNIVCLIANVGKLVREKVSKLASSVQENNFDSNLEMVCIFLLVFYLLINIHTFIERVLFVD